MICEKYENRVTAQTVLGNIVKFAEQHCSIVEKPYEVSRRISQMIMMHCVYYTEKFDMEFTILKNSETRVVLEKFFSIHFQFQVLLKPDRMEAVIHHFLPCGQVRSSIRSARLSPRVENAPIFH
jgi:hypothetical protein